MRRGRWLSCVGLSLPGCPPEGRLLAAGSLSSPRPAGSAAPLKLELPRGCSRTFLSYISLNQSLGLVLEKLNQTTAPGSPEVSGCQLPNSPAPGTGARSPEGTATYRA